MRVPILVDWAVQGVMLAATFGLVFLGIMAFSESGPSCPGKDPSWIGWCSEAPDAR